MFGGVNKLLRNLASLKGKGDFEKRLIKAAYKGDMKEPKQKHVEFIVDCLKGKHLDLIRPKEASKKLFDTICSNANSSPILLKGMSIIHSALQEEEPSPRVGTKRPGDHGGGKNRKSEDLTFKDKEMLDFLGLNREEMTLNLIILENKIKEKEAMNERYQKGSIPENNQTSKGRLRCHEQGTQEPGLDSSLIQFFCENYIQYIKNLANFQEPQCKLFSIHLKDLHHYSKKLKEKELFMIISRIDELIEQILRLFEKKALTHNNRLLSHIYYQLYVDQLKIYQSYYLLMTVLLDKFPSFPTIDKKRALIIYNNFLRMNSEIKKISTQVIREQHVDLKIHFYDVDTKVLEFMKMEIDVEEKNLKKKDNSTSISSSLPSKNNTEEGLIKELFEEIDKKQCRKSLKLTVSDHSNSDMDGKQLDFQEELKDDSLLNDLFFDSKCDPAFYSSNRPENRDIVQKKTQQYEQPDQNYKLNGKDMDNNLNTFGDLKKRNTDIPNDDFDNHIELENYEPNNSVADSFMFHDAWDTPQNVDFFSVVQ